MNNKANNCLTFEKIAEIKDFMDNKTNKIMVVNHRKMDGDAI
jgi:hypothetical protein